MYVIQNFQFSNWPVGVAISLWLKDSSMFQAEVSYQLSSFSAVAVKVVK